MKNIIKTEYLRQGDTLTAFMQTEEPCVSTCTMQGKDIPVISNAREPYDFKLQMVTFNEAELRAAGSFTMTLKHVMNGETVTCSVDFDENSIIPLETAIQRPLRGLKKIETTAEGSNGGMRWTQEKYETPDGAPVQVYTTYVDMTMCDIIAGTPNAEPVFRPKVIQTVMEEAESFERIGKRVLAASNADFFNIFGDCSPSGLCVSQGQIVACADSPAPFFGINKEGKPVIGTINEIDPASMREAVGGGQIILEDGQIADTAPLQPFGEIPHPRTAFGITADGNVIILIVDGRRPVWSNGAALTELCMLMQEKGAVKAMNADGGGSSTIIVRKGETLEMINHPADLFRPMEDLVRPLFDSIIVVAR